MRPCPRASSALIVLLAVAGVASPAGGQLRHPPSRVVDYRIDARLDPATHRIDGRQRITWRNPAPTAIREIWLHLYSTPSATHGARSCASARPHGRRSRAPTTSGAAST